MWTLANDVTADQLPDYLASETYGAAWTRYADLADWVSLYNLGTSGEWLAASPETWRAGDWPKRGGRPRGCQCD